MKTKLLALALLAGGSLFAAQRPEFNRNPQGFQGPAVRQQQQRQQRKHRRHHRKNQRAPRAFQHNIQRGRMGR